FFRWYIWFVPHTTNFDQNTCLFRQPVIEKVLGLTARGHYVGASLQHKSLHCMFEPPGIPDTDWIFCNVSDFPDRLPQHFVIAGSVREFSDMLPCDAAFRRLIDHSPNPPVHSIINTQNIKIPTRLCFFEILS